MLIEFIVPSLKVVVKETWDGKLIETHVLALQALIIEKALRKSSMTIRTKIMTSRKVMWSLKRN